LASHRLLRLEDGFLRSVGLGAELTRPMSWVVDERGLYYDSRQPSDLEHLLATWQFDEALLWRARTLRQRIVEQGITKYNVGAATWQPPPGEQRPLLLVVGQVESDASLALGAPGIHRNIDLLRAVRTSHPQHAILYKPHPDVTAGLRKAGREEELAGGLCDYLVTDVPLENLLQGVAMVHVMTSLAGFEALLRGKEVVCHGQPFYAGWGLTRDQLPLARRNRRLTLDQLVAGCLILYPLYFHRHQPCRIAAEEALEQLIAWRDASGSSQPWWNGGWRMLLRWVVGVR
ncbi:MAG: beta-3-deoxy-D-manno-oct-2-ulosonic acid transferase, partial [Magnetococcales bacterium]|nr:beta-3-deoxy-D-manno-oct-2-ulosonic acid transferase [Magnetococcales bacterium]NGZ28986.1 beta-3-deoxy-D-manno-oct-2-ulosonic acid transferase [Magnetococcales bacterium]